jgi:tRNA A37 methylthiotransferase MiaB
MKGAVPAEEAHRRYEELMTAQQEVAFESAGRLVGKRIETLVESEREGGGFEGRTYMDAPEVDCKAIIRTHGVEPGQTVSLEVIDTEGYDLILE